MADSAWPDEVVLGMVDLCMKYTSEFKELLEDRMWNPFDLGKEVKNKILRRLLSKSRVKVKGLNP